MLVLLHGGPANGCTMHVEAGIDIIRIDDVFIYEVDSPTARYIGKLDPRVIQVGHTHESVMSRSCN